MKEVQTMNFTLSTKPLADALNLGVINSNVSNFYQKSSIAEIKADQHNLTINLEADSITSEISLRGSGDESSADPIFVSCINLKQLVNSLDNNVTTLEFTESGLVVHNGKSKFTLEKVLDTADLSLNRPATASAADNQPVPVNKDNWKFVKDHQMYAISVAYIHPVYTKVYAGNQGDIFVGDFDNSIFTHSMKNQLNKTCLLSDTIINFFNSLPDGSTMVDVHDGYVVSVETDGYTFRSQFKPKYESDPDIGSYNSSIIADLMTVDKSESITIDKSALNKFLFQFELLASSTETIVKMSVQSGILSLYGDKIDCRVAVTGNTDATFDCNFKSSMLKSLISNMDSDVIHINPIIQEGETNGIVVWSDNMEAMLAGVD